MRATTFALVALLTFTAPMQAWAQRAWVLWEKYETLYRKEGPYSRTPNWTLVTAMGDEAHCVRVAENKHLASYSVFMDLKSVRVDPNHNERSVIVTSTDGSEMTRHSFLCLPDTIDPRGPKGGGR
jgi:hypothetical protein